MSVAPENEQALVAAVQSGDTAAFAPLVGPYERKLYRLARHITSNRDDAEEVLQETLLKAYARLRQFRGDSRFSTWLTRIAWNESLMKLRRGRGRRFFSLDAPVEDDTNETRPRELADQGHTPEERCARAELRATLCEAMAGLQPALRVAMLLCDVRELSIAQTAKRLHLSVPAVKSRLLRARRQLRERLRHCFQRPPRRCRNARLAADEPA